MCHGPIEFAESVLTLVDLGGEQAEVMTDSRLPNQLDRLRRALPARQEVSPGNVFLDVLRSVRQKVEDDLSEHLVFLEKLICVEALGVPECAQLHCLGNDGSLGGHIPFRALDVSRDALDEQRHVIDQLVSWENSLRGNRDARGDSIEPLRDERLLGGAESACQR